LSDNILFKTFAKGISEQLVSLSSITPEKFLCPSLWWQAWQDHVS